MRRVKCKTCGVRNEKLDFLSTNTKYTRRFAMQIGGLCRAMTIQDVAREMRLDWHAVKDLDKSKYPPAKPGALGLRAAKSG